MSVWWSIVLSAVAIGTSWLVGNRWTPAWLIAAVSQALWVAYAVLTQQWGFVASAVVFGALNLRNYLKWKQLDREEAARADANGRVQERV